MKKVVISLIVFVIIGVGMFVVSSDEKVEYIKISIDEMYESDNIDYILDVRTIEEYADGHIKNSINFPLDVIENIDDIISDKNKNIYIYCRSGARSKDAALKLIELGYTNVYDIGGILEMDVKFIKKTS